MALGRWPIPPCWSSCLCAASGSGGSVTGTQQFIFCGAEMCEERDGSGAITKQFFPLGEHIGSSSYFFALDHLGLPIDFRPSRATTIRIAQTLDANFVIVGSYTVSSGRIAVQAQVLEVNKLRLSEPIQDSSELSRLFDIENAIADYDLALKVDSKLANSLYGRGVAKQKKGDTAGAEADKMAAKRGPNTGSWCNCPRLGTPARV